MPYGNKGQGNKAPKGKGRGKSTPVPEGAYVGPLTKALKSYSKALSKQGSKRASKGMF